MNISAEDLAGLAKRYLEFANRDLARAFELALADLIVAEKHVSWGLVRGQIDPVNVPQVIVFKAPDDREP